MENALVSNPRNGLQRDEKQLNDLQEDYREAMLGPGRAFSTKA